MPYLADNAYLAIKPESAAGTPIIPTVFVPLVSADVKTVTNHVVDQRMKGISWKGNDLLRGNRMHEGEIVVLADPDMLGHFMNMFMLKGSTTGNGTDGYTHPFTVGQGDTYTFEIKKGIYAQRFFGVYIEEMKFDFNEGQLQITMQIKAMGQFSIGKLGVALSGSVTALVFDDDYDISPNRGLVVGDVIVIGSNEITLTSVNANGIGVGFASTSLTYSVGEEIYLKPLTVSNPTLQDPLYFGNFLVGFGVDEAAATTAAGSRSTATPVYDMEIVLKAPLFVSNGSNRMDPVQIVRKTPEGQITLKRLLENENQRQKFLSREQQAIVMIAYGKFIKSDFTTQEKFTLIFNNVKLIENENALEVGELIRDEQSFEILYDDGDGQAMEAEIVNRTAGTAY